ncbi:hypothetical protein ABI59_10915 [Acidobacteria bacterium Mor1]|nr:hypothetical protein ABI59_10915 [Acidobacteria bacterium Mor1]
MTDLPKPAVEVPAFKQELWRELQHTQRPVHGRGPWIALAASLVVIVGLGALLAAFVADPELAASLRVRLVGGPEPAGIASAAAARSVVGGIDGSTLTLEDVHQVLSRTDASVDLDRAFIEDWSSQQPMPVDVRSMEAESVYTIRKYELSDGKHVLVFTELGSGNPSVRAVADSPASTRVF